MLTVEDAQARILVQFAPLATEEIRLGEALGRVLAVAAVSPIALPPFANSAMDGYALRAADTHAATAQVPARLRLVGEVPAGSVYAGQVAAGEAVRILTGAPVPSGADAVLQQELTEVAGEWVALARPVAPGTNIRAAGEDVHAGQHLLPPGTDLGPAEIALLAATGLGMVHVHRRPRVAILATGDELRAPGEPLGPGQIYESNSTYLAAAVTRAGAEPWPLGIVPDDAEVLRARLRQASAADLVLTSGGVSVGDYDLVKQILAEEGAMDFWRVRMRPGKPLAFGRVGQAPLLGLPGNPVSAAVTFELFGRPAIRRMLGCQQVHRPTVEVVLTGAPVPRGDRRHYVRVRLSGRGGQLVARTTGEQGSHILSSLRGASAYLVVAEGTGSIAPGETVPALLLNDALPWEAEAPAP